MSSNSAAFKKNLSENHIAINYAIQLYEKGIMSDETLSEIVGLDAKEEKGKLKSKPSLVYESPTRIQEVRIEQARRNVEVLGRFVGCETFPKRDELMSAMMKNVAIMEESIQVK